MPDGELVSTIIIFLDGERFIEEAIASVFAQTYPHWELLLVDDGSTDGSSAIARRLAEKHPDRVRYLEHPGHANRGMSASRNLGISAARGTYVGFLDADDTWLPAKLAEQVPLLRAHPEAAMIYGRTLIWHGWTGRPEDIARDHTMDLGVPADTLVPPPRLFFVLLANKSQSPTTCNALLRRDVLERVGGFVESFRTLYEDQVLFLKIHLAWPVYVASTCWARYRQQSGNYNEVRSIREYHQGRRQLLEWLAAYVAEQGLGPESDVARAVQRELWPSLHPTLHRVVTAPRQLAGRMRDRLGELLRGSGHHVTG
jgi:glycosyltransferase involved in cell wall biosynthesis